MTTTWFVSRHTGAVDWAKQHGVLDDANSQVRTVSEIHAETVALGDYVIGTLPVHLVAEICARGAHYLHISMQVPAELRGTELTAAQMDACGASCREFLVLPASDDMIAVGSEQPLPEPGASVHVCLVSDQYMANLLPILKRKPCHVELIYTSAMKTGLERLTRALTRFGYGSDKVTCHKIDDAASTDFAVARIEASSLRNVLHTKHPGLHLTINATGGTKIMSSAFFLEFQGFEVIYTDSQNGS